MTHLSRNLVLSHALFHVVILIRRGIHLRPHVSKWPYAGIEQYTKRGITACLDLRVLAEAKMVRGEGYKEYVN